MENVRNFDDTRPGATLRLLEPSRVQEEAREVQAYLDGPIARSQTVDARDAAERVRARLRELREAGVTDADLAYLFGESDAPAAHR